MTNSSPELELVLFILAFWLLGNSFRVAYLTRAARKGELSPMKFTSVAVLGYSSIISAILLFLLGRVDGVSLQELGFVSLVFALHILIGFPTGFLLSKFLMRKYFPKWSSHVDGSRS
jgi:hypothetical protein